MSKVSLRRLAGGTTFPKAVPTPKCQKGLSDLVALVSPLGALQMTLFVCLQRQPGRLRRSYPRWASLTQPVAGR